MHEQKTYTSGFGFSSTHFRTASSVALIGAFMSIIGRGYRGRSGEYSSTGRFPLSFAWISGGGSDELPATRGISSPTSTSPPSTFTSTASPSCLYSPSPYSLATALTSSQPWIAEGAVSTRVDILSSAVAMVLVVLVISSTKSFWGSVPAALVEVGHQPVESMNLLLQVGAFPSSKALPMYPNPKPPDFISACCLIDSSLNVQDRKAGISGTALAARFVISICPIGSPRVAATSAAVIWIDCPFWSCKHAPGQAAEFVLLLARV
nr:hypothetical protein Iba_chr11dCG10400 [Ipomoea batatas]